VAKQYPAAPLGFCAHGHRFSPWRATRVRRHLCGFARARLERNQDLRNQQVAIRDTMLGAEPRKLHKVDCER